jgi:hypothetical protein
MKLKHKYGKQEDIPAGFESLFEEKNGEWVLTGIEGVKTQEDVDRLQRSLTAERSAHKATKDAFKALDGMDLEEVVSKLDRFDELEAAAAGNGNKDVDARVEAALKSRIAPIERERDNLKKERDELSGKVQTFEAENRTRSIHDTVREQAAKLNILPGALDDALMLADRALVVNEHGEVVVREGAKGFTEGVDAGTWLTEVRETKTHWWPASEGGGAGGGNQNGTGTNPWSKAGWNMTEQGKILTANRAKAENMAKSAGTTIGGPRPEK